MATEQKRTKPRRNSTVDWRGTATTARETRERKEQED